MRKDVIALQHEAEAHGVRFNVVAGPHALPGLIVPGDDLFVLGDGLFASVEAVQRLLGDGDAVLVQPIDRGLAAGFERIDLTTASAGAFRVPGRLVDGLADLPPDCDAASSLQRLALQNGIPQRPIAAGSGEEPAWTLIRNDAEALKLEPQWIRMRTTDGSPTDLTRLLALQFVRRFGPSLLHAGSGASHLAAAAALLAAIAFAAGLLGYFAAGLVVCAFAWLCAEAASLLARVADEPSPAGRRSIGQAAVFGWLTDALIVSLAGLGSTAQTGLDAGYRLFPALMLVALVRLVPRLFEGRWTAWPGDRSLLSLGLAAAVASGFGNAAIHIAAGGLALAAMVAPIFTKRLTRA